MSDIDKRSGSGPDSRQLLCVAPDNKKVKCNGGVTIGIVIQIKILYSSYEHHHHHYNSVLERMLFNIMIRDCTQVLCAVMDPIISECCAVVRVGYHFKFLTC